MSLFRGFDTYMTSRVQRAKGDHHYFDVDSLRFFDAFGGAAFALPASLDPSRRFVVIVESVRPPHGVRRYRPTVVLFTPDTEHGGESVEVFHPYDDDAASAPTTGATATRRAQAYALNVLESVSIGVPLETAARESVY